MKAAGILCCSILFLVCAAFGQNAHPSASQILSDPEAFATAHILAMDRQLHLTDEQKAQIKPLFVCEAAQLQLLLANHSITDPRILISISRLHLQMRAKIAALLTPEQKERFIPPQIPPAQLQEEPSPSPQQV